MRKICVFMIVAALLFSIASVSLAEENWDEFFRCVEGQISFTLPNVPTVYHEPDLPAQEVRENTDVYNGWTDKIQLTGYTKEETEFQVHIADLGEMMEWMKEDHPESDETELRLNAMSHLAWFYMQLYDGIYDGNPVAEEIEMDGKIFPVMTFSYSYPDAPGIAYLGKGIMDGERAVILMGQQGGDWERMLAQMTVIPAADAEAFRAKKNIPETVTLGRMRITFPCAPDLYSEEGAAFADVFSADYVYLSAEYMAADMSRMRGNMDMDTALRHMAVSAARGYEEDGVLTDSKIEKIADGIYGISAYGVQDEMAASANCARDYVRMFVTVNGVYVIESMDTENGRAFIDSIVFDAAE